MAQGSGSSGTSGTLQKLRILSFKDDKFSEKNEIGGGNEFEVLVNPATINHSLTVSLKENNDQLGGNEGKSDFNNTPPETLSFEIILDGTGIFSQGKEVSEVADELEKLRKCCYEFIGDKHEIPYVIIAWGSLQFGGRVKSFDIEHVLFKTDGNPLRSKVKLSFSSTMNAKEAVKKALTSSPDLTHVRTVYAGDKLPAMCETIYGQPERYLEVARVNGIVDFRNLTPGMEITFPPLK